MAARRRRSPAARALREWRRKQRPRWPGAFLAEQAGVQLWHVQYLETDRPVPDWVRKRLYDVTGVEELVQ